MSPSHHWLKFIRWLRNVDHSKVPLGAIPDITDIRDKDFQVLAKGAQIPSSFVLTQLTSPVKDQGRAGSCVANALSLLYEIELRNKTGVEFAGSRRQLYYDARILGNLFPGDNGSRPRDALKVMLNYGLSPEKLCLYSPDIINEEPDEWARSFQPWFKIKSFHRIESVAAVREEIAEEHAVALNIPIYNNFYSSVLDIPLPQEGMLVLGYHEMAIIGYDDLYKCPDGSIGAFLIQNSWGTQNWGSKGCSWMPYAWFNTNLPGNPAPTDFWSIRLS